MFHATAILHAWPRPFHLLLLTGALAAAVLSGCNGQDTTTGAPGTEQAGADGAGALEIAVIPKGTAHQFWLTVKAGAEAAAKERGATIAWQGPAKETEVEKQINIVQDMVNRGVDGMVLAACNEVALIQPVQQVLDAGIPVVTMDSGIDSDIPLSFVATDNIAGARAAADKLAELIGGAGKVGLIPFVPGAATSTMREEGFKQGLQDHPEVQLVATIHCHSDVAKAMAAAEDMISAHPDLKGIFAANEAAAIGAAQGIKRAGKTGEIKLVAFDAAEEELAALKEGAIQALIVQNPFRIGHDSVTAVLDAIEGKEVAKRIDTGVTVVTLDNLDDPEVQTLLNPLGA